MALSRFTLQWIAIATAAFGAFFFAIPLYFVWYVSDYDRFLAMIRGPFPFSLLGSGPIQLWGGAFCILTGTSFVLFAMVLFIRLRTGDAPQRYPLTKSILTVIGCTLLFLVATAVLFLF